LNLVAASQVILADSWWAPSIEDQAIDRVNRLGQTRRVTVFRLVIKDSIEDRVIEIQQRKRKMISEAFDEKKGGNQARAAKMTDLKLLLSGKRRG
jgi:SWI/SNF-related matrix-associated actin-dependent regulator of chromatin subfamily A3